MITKEISELEQLARKLETEKKQRKEVSFEAIKYVNEFLEDLPNKPGYVKGDLPKLKELSIQDKEKPLGDLLDILGNEVDKLGINYASGRLLGYIPGGGLYASAIADMLAAATNRYAGTSFSNPGAVEIENQMIRWMNALVGYPETAHGNLTSGGSIANLTAIKTARDFHGINSRNVKETVIYLTKHTHHCIDKALSITGLDEAILRNVAVDSKYRMDANDLGDKMKTDKNKGLTPFLVIGTAGTTNTGAIDPLDRIAELCSVYDTWFHVDAAYGGFFMLLDEVKDKFSGIERSDSIVMDPHKTLFLPYGSGGVLVKNTDALIQSYSKKAAYMKDSYGQMQINPADSGPELSKHFRGLRMWLPLHLYGIKPFKANLKEKILLCRYFHREVKEKGFEIGPFPQLSVSCFRYPNDDDNTLTQELIDRLHADGRFFFSSTLIDGKLWIRCAVVNFRTHLKEIKFALEVIKNADSEVMN